MSLIPEIREGQSLELLKELHILTREGKLNQDTRRKLKQIHHLYQFIEPLLEDSTLLVDMGAGKSYLGFILYDLFFKTRKESHVWGIETRGELVEKSRELAARLGFSRMSFLPLSVEESMRSGELPTEIGVVTALHACDTATDDAITFGLRKKAKHMVLVPCCQAEVAATLRQTKGVMLKTPLTEVWRHPLHTREFGSHLTNVLRCLRLESHGYQVRVTELVGWEHSMKNELIMASYKDLPRQHPRNRLDSLLEQMGLRDIAERFA